MSSCKSFFDHTGLAQQEKATRIALNSAFETARNRKAISWNTRSRMDYENAVYLYAVNPFAHIRWGEAICDAFAEHFELDSQHMYPNQRIYFVTLVDIDCSTEHDADIENVEKFKRRLRTGLRGLSYIAVMEPAYYVNIAKGARYKNKRGIFWHFHAIAWGESEAAIKKRIRRLNARKDHFRAIADGLQGAHCLKIPESHLADKFRYMLKSPKKAYRLYKTEKITKDGEVLPYFKQKTADLRPGDRLTLFMAMKELYLDELTIAGGEGRSILEPVKREARQAIDKYNDRFDRHSASLYAKHGPHFLASLRS